MAKGTKGLKASPKAGSAGRGISQKLGTGTMKGVSGMDLSSKLEKAASVPYKGHSVGVKHGATGVLSGRGGGKKGGVPNL